MLRPGWQQWQIIIKLIRNFALKLIAKTGWTWSWLAGKKTPYPVIFLINGSIHDRPPPTALLRQLEDFVLIPMR